MCVDYLSFHVNSLCDEFSSYVFVKLCHELYDCDNDEHLLLDLHYMGWLDLRRRESSHSFVSVTCLALRCDTRSPQPFLGPISTEKLRSSLLEKKEEMELST